MIQRIKDLLPKTVRSKLGAVRTKFRDRVYYYYKRKIFKELRINNANGDSFHKVILIVIDSLRKDSLSYYDYKRETTPFIDSLIQDNRSVAFHNFHGVSSWTYPSVTSILSGLYPHKHGGIYPKEYRNLHIDRPNRWNDEIIFLPDVFKKLGYETIFLSPIGSAYLASQGLFKHNYFSLKFQNTDSIFKKMKQIVSSEYQKQFIHCQIGGLHYPVFVPESFKNFFEEIPNDIDNLETFDYLDNNYSGNKSFERYSYYRKLYYDVALRYIDNHLESFFSFLEQRGLLQNSLIIITSDHGEEFWDHIEEEYKYFKDPRPMYGFGHAHNLFQEILELPLCIFHGDKPNKVIRQYSQELLSQIDLFNMLLFTNNISLENYGNDGIDFSNPDSKHEVLIAEDIASGYEKKVVIAPPYKLLVSIGDDVSWLFNIDEDQAEKHPIENDELKTKLKEFLPKNYLNTENSLQYDKNLEENLRALGYLE